MHYRLFALFTVFCISLQAFSQSKIEADRPSNAISVAVAEKNNFITEVGFEREVQENSIFYLSPRTYFRYGIGSNIELRLLTEVTTKKDLETKELARGLQPVHLGAKMAIFKEHGWRPAASIVFSTDIPFLSSRSLKNTHWSPDLRLLFNNKLSDKLSFDYNLGAEWSGEHIYPGWIYATTLEYEITDHSEIYGEFYGQVIKNSLPGENLGAGYAHFLKDNLKFDFGFSKDLIDSKAWFAGAGFSFLIR